VRVLGYLLLAAGYLAAVPVVVRLKRVFGERRERAFAVFAGGMVAIVAGYLLADRPAPAAVNGAALVVLAGAWRVTGRRRASPP
jgi:hypothetical protein